MPNAPRFPGGEYEIESVVGKGGMAIVYKARDMRHPRVVAIKVLRPEVAQSIGTTRFLREIAVAAPFSHPHILPLIDSGELVDEQGRTTPYYVMPLVDGETLHQKLVREGRLPLQTVLRITREILEALQYAHAQGVIHRDIKPANILLSGGHAVVADFGVSRPLHAVLPSNDIAEPALTMTGDVIGTPSYMSPEQATGTHAVDARSDIFSVGCVMYEMIVGDRPFDTPIPQYTATKKRHGIFASARDARPEVSEELDKILATALKPDPADRYASAAAMLHALAQLDTKEKDASGWGLLTQRVPASWTRNTLIGSVAIVAVIAAATKSGRSASLPDSTAVAAPALASDKSRVAVLPIEQLTPDSLLNIVANGFQTDLIDELAQYPALTVISKNGVLQFRGDHASTDSIARALNVGSVVTGDIRHVGDSVRVTVRLIDGATGAVRSTAQDSGSILDLLAVRSAVINKVTEFLRTEIGHEVRASQRAEVRSSEAWEIQSRVMNMTQAEMGLALSLSPALREQRFKSADSMLARAISLDKRWPAPLVTTASIYLQRASLDEQGGARDAASAREAQERARSMRMRAITLANEALQLDPGNSGALYARGKSTFELWRQAKGSATEALRASAEDDLRKAVAGRRDMALAWNDLSTLYQLNGDFAKARIAADSALKSDAFLKDAPSVVSKIFQTYLATGEFDQARRWCEHGRERFADRPEFWSCQLTLMGWTGKSAADVAEAWRLLQAIESRDSSHMLASGAATRQLFVAAVAARAGLNDSAAAIANRVRRSIPAGVISSNADYGEAYVQTLLHHNDEALTLLERFLQSSPSQRGYVRKGPWFAPLSDNARFIAMTSTP